MNADSEFDAADAAGPTPLSVRNRAGLAALSWRVGTHPDFYATMKTRLSSWRADAGTVPPLAGLTTRESGDPAIAMLDAWATVADVLTFYQERIANEGFLRTAVEDGSVQALAAMVGFVPRPGLAASVFLAYDVDDPGGGADVVVPAGSPVQSAPAAPGSLPQTFETSARLVARPAWSRLRPRQNRPQQASLKSTELYFDGIATGLQPNDPLLLVAADAPLGAPLRVARVEPQYAANRTRVVLQTPVAPRRAVVSPSVAAAADGPGGGAAPGPAEPPAPVSPLANPAVLANLARSAPAPSPRRATRAGVGLAEALAADSDLAAQVATAFAPALKPVLATALARTAVAAAEPPVEVHAFRVRAAPFGHNAPLQAVADPGGGLPSLREWTLRKDGAEGAPEPFRIDAEFGPAPDVRAGVPPLMRVVVKIGDHPAQTGENDALRDEFTIVDREADEETVVTIKENLRFAMKRRGITLTLTPAQQGGFTASASGCDWVRLEMAAGDAAEQRAGGRMAVRGRARRAPGPMALTETAETVSLDAVRAAIVPGTWALVERPDEATPVVGRVLSSVDTARVDYGLSGATTRVGLDVAWLGRGGRGVADESFADVIRGSSVHVRSEPLALAAAPIADPVGGATIELDGIQIGLDAGRWLIVEGERADVDGVPGIRAAEVARLAGASHPATGDAPGETAHTLLTLAAPLVHRYRRETVTVQANVVHATHGETQRELLGSGDGSRPSQAFATRQGPLTFVPSSAASGAASTLEVRVNDIRWHEVDGLEAAGPDDRSYTTRRNADGSTAIVFGDGRHGARLPTGVDNVRAVYRRGLGLAGDVAAGQVTMLASRPLGVTAVTNPVAASGGADPETAASARRNAPLGLLTLDRVVSVADHADFARVHAGVGKAAATRLPAAAEPIVCVTIAAADETPLEASSDVCVDLAESMRRQGDPRRPLRVLPAELMLLVVEARVRLGPDHAWPTVEAALRAALAREFGYDARDLGEDAVLSQLVGAMQRVPGVDGIDVDRFDAIGQASRAADLARVVAAPARRPAERVQSRAARRGPDGQPLPAQVVFVSARVPGLVRLAEADA